VTKSEGSPVVIDILGQSEISPNRHAISAGLLQSRINGSVSGQNFSPQTAWGR